MCDPISRTLVSPTATLSQGDPGRPRRQVRSGLLRPDIHYRNLRPGALPERDSGPRVHQRQDTSRIQEKSEQPPGQAASFSLTQSPDTGNTVTASIPKSDSDQLIRTELFDVGLAGSEYRAYVRPLRIVIQEPEGKQKKLPSLFVGGLRRKSRIESEAASFPYST